MKFHIGCGTIYLREWVNIDLPLPHVFLAKERPDLVEKRITDEDKYYARHEDKTPENLRGGALTQESVCDAFGGFGFMPARDGTVSELLARQCIEHIGIQDVHRAMDEAFRVLKVGGILRVDVPDPDETLKLYRETGDPFWIRHLFGPRRTKYGGHTPYNRQMLRSAVEELRFKFLGEENNIHFYPAFCLRWEKW